MDLFAFTTIELTLLYILAGFLLIQILYYIVIYGRVLAHNTATGKGKIEFSEEYPPVSVVVTANNDSENIRKYLPAILEQDYPNFEVIVVNESASDESEDVLKLMQTRYPHLYHTFTPDSSRYVSQKKLALTIGIKASKHDWIVFTEINCRPASNQWIKLLARNFTAGTSVVLGYSGYETAKGWLARKSRFYNLLTSLRYLGWALLGKPYMGKGYNMAYRKELFFNNKGFSAHLNLQRGEDDLFINMVATPANTRVETSPESIVKIEVPQSSQEWENDKVSYAVTSRYFKGGQPFLNGGETFSRMLFYKSWISVLAISIFYMHWIMLGFALLAYIIRILVQMIIFNKTADRFNEKKYYLQLPLFDLLQPLYSLKFKIKSRLKSKREFMRI